MALQKLKIFVKEITHDDNFFVGLFMGLVLSTILVLNTWNDSFLALFITWALLILILNAAISLGFVLGFCLIVLIFGPKNHYEIILSLIILILLNFFLFFKFKRGGKGSGRT